MQVVIIEIYAFGNDITWNDELNNSEEIMNTKSVFNFQETCLYR